MNYGRIYLFQVKYCMKYCLRLSLCHTLKLTETVCLEISWDHGGLSLVSVNGGPVVSDKSVTIADYDGNK